MASRRIVALIPGATEIVVALGVGDRLVGRSHECDFPPRVGDLPVVTTSTLPEGLTDQAAIDRAVTAAARAGRPLYRVRDDVLGALAPDLMITQGLCAVCAVDPSEAARAAAALAAPARVLSLAPESLAGTLEAIRAVGSATGVPEAAEAVLVRLEARLARVRAAVAGRPRPRVACLEWLDPPFTAGHWVPEQVEAAGGEDALAAPGSRSARVTPAQVAAAAPDVIVLMPCGFDRRATETAATPEVLAPYAGTPAGRSGRIHAVDANGLFSRPGPRLVDGVEALAALLHPGAFPPPESDAVAGPGDRVARAV